MTEINEAEKQACSTCRQLEQQAEIANLALARHRGLHSKMAEAEGRLKARPKEARRSLVEQSEGA